VRKRNFKRWKLQQVIGIKEELDNAYLSAQFPVLQRLQYTKWPPKKLMERVFIRFNLVKRAFVNQVQPNILQSVALLGLYFGTALLLNCFWLFFEVPGEKTPAEEKYLNDLVWEISPWETPMTSFNYLIPWQMIIGAIVVEHICRLLHFVFWRQNFIHTDADLNGLTTIAARREVLRRFHSRSQRGMRNAILYTFAVVGAAVALAGLLPQKRAASATQALILQLFYGLLLFPAGMAAAVGTVLIITTKKGLFDGLVSYFPSLIDFEWAGISSPPSLARRFVQIEKEARIMEMIYADGGILDEKTNPVK